MIELGEEVFHLPVRIGVPSYVGGLADVVRSPRYATAVGLLLDGREQFLRAEIARAQGAGLTNVAGRVKEWVKGDFCCRRKGTPTFPGIFFPKNAGEGRGGLAAAPPEQTKQRSR